MIDGVGNVSSILLLNGVNEVGLAIVERLVGPRLQRVVLAGPPSPGLAAAARFATDLGVADVRTPAFELAEVDAHESVFADIFRADIDVVVLCTDDRVMLNGLETNPMAAAEQIQQSLVGAAAASIGIGHQLVKQGHGVFVIALRISDSRTARSDYVFAAAMNGLDTFATGFAAAMADEGIRVLIARLAEPSVAHPRLAADAIAAAVRTKRHDVVYVPTSFRSVRPRTLALPKRRRGRSQP